MGRARHRTVFVGLVLVSLVSVAAAQEPQKPPRPPENVKILTDLQGQALRAEMQRMAAALGVKCDYCHVQGNFASDENRKKVVARRMLELTKGINAQYFSRHEVKEGESTLGRVTCYTCHQGTTEPKMAAQ
jgi:cytochrome c5